VRRERRTLERNRGAALFALIAAALLPIRPQPACAYDAEAGRQKAEAVCAACHGPGGNSLIATIPSLAGQQPRYITLALYQFRAGHRKSEQMAPIAASLTDEDLGDLSAYYAAQPAGAPKRTIDPQQAAAARRLTEADHCTQCHGASLAGDEHIPRLAGQHFAYLEQQLQAFKAATRGDIDGNMTSAAQGLSGADIDLLATYIATLKAP
jgi:cytochrome c553